MCDFNNIKAIFPGLKINIWHKIFFNCIIKAGNFGNIYVTPIRTFKSNFKNTKLHFIKLKQIPTQKT